MTFPFHEDPNTAAIVCRHVLEKERTILYISHDADDGSWQFLCGAEHAVEDARVISLNQILDLDSTVADVADMERGCFAERIDLRSPWVIEHED